MADSIFAASSTTGPGSSERIASEFMSQGRPDAPSNVVEGEILGGFQIRTPKVGDGFIEWAIAGYDLEGKHANPPAGVEYDKHGDWLYDKTSHTIRNDGNARTEDYYDNNYATGGPQTAMHDKTRKER